MCIEKNLNIFFIVVSFFFIEDHPCRSSIGGGLTIIYVEKKFFFVHPV